MILQALVDYYEILEKDGQISKPGYCMAGVSFALNLSVDGKLIGVMPLKTEEQRGKKTVGVPQKLRVPEKDTSRTVNVKADFLCDNSGYILGIDNKGRPERTRQCFEAFKALHHKVLDGVGSVPAKAVLRFLDSWESDKAGECNGLEDELEALMAGANIIFNITGMGYAHENEAVRHAWEQYITQKDNTAIMQCLVTGQEAPVARTHAKIKGVKYSQAMGNSLVSFNARAYESYGRDEQQGMNAPVSEYAAFAYTTALNYLLADTAHKQSYGDTTIVYWAQSPKPIYRDLFAFSLSPESADEMTKSSEMAVDKRTEKLLSDMFEKLMEGKAIADGMGNSIDPDTRFFILGLAPNAARLSVRFFLRGSFGQFIDNMRAHHNALEIDHAPWEKRFLKLRWLMQETVSPSSRDKAASPLLSGAVLRSILTGQDYPALLLSSVMTRIRAEHDVSRGKAAIIKAYLLKNCKDKYKEVLKMSLNEEWNEKPYVLGRLFAVLEKAQMEANPGINATIKDRFFTSACATPGMVFPRLLLLASHHTAKAKYGYTSEKKIRDLEDKLEVQDNPYPAHLDFYEQGIFILGYYHQIKANYPNKELSEKSKEEE